MKLEGACVVVTGGSRGIGKALASAFAARGGCVVIGARSRDEVEATVAGLGVGGASLLGVPTDVTDPQQVERMAALAEREFGPVRVLVNNAGSLTAIGPTWELDRGQWLTDIQTNLWGTFLCCRAIMPGMVAQGHGYVINLVGGGATSPHVYGSGYGCSKAGVLAFTETLALEAADAGVKVFALSPGLVRTRMTTALAERPEGRRWRPFIGRMLEDGRDVPPEEAAQLALKLVSGRADRLSGCLFSVSDDFDAIVQAADAVLQSDGLRLRLRPWSR
jgi:NAD(P)-dependent dehydrogenase (short-subunit alcohol dehydrogenase family)